MDDLYRDYIHEHHRRPDNFGVVEDADASCEGSKTCCLKRSRSPRSRLRTCSYVSICQVETQVRTHSDIDD